MSVVSSAGTTDFYPRSPCGERLFANFEGFYWWVISIHALLAESDPGKVKVVEPGFVFLSTLSLRRATVFDLFRGSFLFISIHALLAESDNDSPDTWL